MEFYAPDSQPILGPVVMLPQKGSPTGGSKRPMNAYAIQRDDYTILFDAPFSWTLDAVRDLATADKPPLALVLSHRDLVGAGDAFDTYREDFGLTLLMHPADQREKVTATLSTPLEDPTTGQGAEMLAEAGLELIHIPGHSPGSIMLYLAGDFDGSGGGILLAGDSAVGPGPAQTDQSPRLERPLGADEHPRFIDTWRETVDRLALAAVLPLHGAVYRRIDHPDRFDAIVSNIWTGEPMDPRRV